MKVNRVINIFKNHKAKLEKDNITTILTWKEPDTIEGQINYVFFGYKLIITGDYGEAIFALTQKAELETIAKTYTFDYFLEKWSCSSRKYTSAKDSVFFLYLEGLKMAYNQLKNSEVQNEKV